MKTKVEILRKAGDVFEQIFAGGHLQHQSPSLALWAMQVTEPVQGIVPLLMHVWPQNCAFI